MAKMTYQQAVVSALYHLVARVALVSAGVTLDVVAVFIQSWTPVVVSTALLFASRFVKLPSVRG